MIRRIALMLMVVQGTVVPLAAQKGVASLGPEWSEEPRRYATTAALFADSLAVSWDGEEAVTVRLRVIEVINGAADRFVSGGSFGLEPGSMRIVLDSLMPAGMIGASGPVIRWAQAGRMVSGLAMTPRGWEDEMVPRLFGEEFSVDWTKESLLLLAITAVEERDLKDVDVMPLLVARPRPPLEPDLR